MVTEEMAVVAVAVETVTEAMAEAVAGPDF